MKKNKFIILIFLIFILTGCHKEYSLTIGDNEIKEELNIIVDNTKENKEQFSLDYYPFHANTEEKYNKKISEEGNLLNVQFNYIYSPSEFINANSLTQCFYDREVILDNEDYYYFKVSKVLPCMSDYDTNINIITDNKVLKNNADKVIGDKYIWYLRNDNKDSFNLEIKIAKNTKSNNNFIIKIIVGFGIFILVLIIIKCFKIKKNSVNKI